jgi:hypothetical protein
MTTIFMALMTFYVDLFALLSDNRAKVLRENRLILGSIEYLSKHYREEGKPSNWAFGLALWEHLADLHPFALYEKSRLDASSSGTSLESRPLIVIPHGLLVLTVFLVVGIVMLVLSALLLWPQDTRKR